MNQLLKELISYIILEETGFIAVSLGKGGASPRVVYFKTEKTRQDAIKKGTHRKYNPNTDKNLQRKSSGADKTTAPAEPVAKPSEKPADKPVQKPAESPSGTVPSPQGIQSLNSTELAQNIRVGFDAPGNAFSKYSEAVSIFVSKYIVDNPGASDEEIMSVLTTLDCNSKTFTPTVTATIPRRFSAQYKKLKESGAFSSGCTKQYSEAQNRARFMTMIVAKMKAERMAQAIQRTGLSGVNVDSFSGDQGSLSALKRIIEDATGKFYSEKGEELTKEEVSKYISGFGTSEFPADTALVGKDASGNIILLGFSDKKDLAAIINNSTVTKEMNRTISTLDSLLVDKKITEEEHKQLTSTINKLSSDYEKEEQKLKDVTSSPATKLVEIAETDSTRLNELVSKAKTLSTGDYRQKYWDERIAKFQSAAKKKATPSNENDNLQWLRKAGWDGKSEVSDALALTAFAYKCQDILMKGDEDLPKDDQKVLFRLGVVDPKEMVAKVGEIRKNALKILAQTRTALDQVQVIGLPLGTLMDGIRAWKGLHLDMGDFKGALSMVAEDNVVDYESIEKCLGGLTSLQDFASNLSINTRDIKSKEYGITTGASVEVFSVTPTGEKINVGVRNIRSKDGILGRLQTTWTYHPEFQQCLSSKKG
jgi:hypothetical protein